MDSSFFSAQSPKATDGQSRGGFKVGHVAAIAGCCLFLLAVSWVKSGFAWKPTQTPAEPIMTYEQARAEVLANNPLSDRADAGKYAAETAGQLAVIDPSSREGSVLGASTEELFFPSVDQMITPEILEKIKVRLSGKEGKEAVQAYAENMLLVESNFQAFSLFADLNSQDKEVLRSISSRAKKMVAALGQVEVPKELERYHQLKLMYYTTVGYMGGAFSGDRPELNMESLTGILFSLTERLGSWESDILSQYGIRI